MTIRRWLTILEGQDPHTAVPILASDDPALISVVAREVARRLESTDGAGSGEHLALAPADIEA